MTIKTHGRMVTDNTVGIPQLAITDGSPGQTIVTDGAGTMTFATVGAGGAVGSSVYIEDIFTGDGTTATFTLSTGAPYEESILTFIDGVAQPTSAFTLPSTTSITFSPAPSNGAAIRVCHLGIASSVANNSITGAKLSMGGDVAGDILYYNGTDYQKLGIGTAGQHLATNSTTNAPEWVASFIPAGGLIPYAGATAPAGWLLCFGQAISRTVYSTLFTAIGTTYGVGDGSTTFALPDMRGRVAAGQDDMGGTSANHLTTAASALDGDVLGATGGRQDFDFEATGAPGVVDGGWAQVAATGANGLRYGNVQPTIILNYIIKT
jgi:microcystin-dependent protein